MSNHGPFLFVFRQSFGAQRECRKKLPQKSQRVGLMDEAKASCRTIESLADLLECSGTDKLKPQTVASAGAVIVNEVAKLQDALRRFENFPS